MQNLESLSIFIPLYNEEQGVENLANQLTKIEDALSKLCSLNFYLVDDGSTDSTYELLQNYFSNKSNYQIIQHEENKNLGGFLRTSLKYCKSDYIGYLDSDCSYSPELLIKMFKKSLSNYDIVNASPYHPDGKVVGVDKTRLYLSKIVNSFYGKLIKKNIYTTSSICKIYKFSLIKDIEIRMENFVSITELFIKALQKDSSYIEYPCELKPREYGSSKMNIFSNIFSHISFIFKLKQRNFN